MIENIPPFDWHKIATKEDLNTLAVVIGAEFTKVASEFAAVRGGAPLRLKPEATRER